MPKQFRTKLAGAVITLSMVVAPVAAFAAENSGVLDGGASIEVVPGDAVDSYYPENDLDGGTGGEIGTLEETEEVTTPQAPEDKLDQPVAEGLGPLGGVMPTLDENGNNTNKVPNKTEELTNKKPNKKTTYKKTTYKKTSSTTSTSNPKTGDVSVLSYAGLGLVSVAGLLRKRK